MHFKAPMARRRATRPFPTLLTRLLTGAVLATALAGAADAADFLILLDLDNNLGTGCTAVTPGGPFSGIEQILTTTVQPTGPASANVTAVSVETCSAGVFGVPVSVNVPVAPPWPVGVGAGDGGTNVIETYLTKALLPAGNTNPQAIRLVVIGDDGGQTADVAGPAVWTLASVIEIPTLGAGGLLLLAALFAAAAILVLRRGGAAGFAIVLLLAGATAAWAAITLDGDPSDWSLADRVTTDPAEGTTPGADIVSVYAKEDTVGGAPSLAFRVDATLLFNQPPVANDDTATVAEDSGGTIINVLANDSDPEADPFTIGSVTASANGTVVNNGTDVTYTPNPNYCNTPPGTTLDTFTYTLTPGGDTATVTVTVTCVVDNPVAVADSATVAEDSGATIIDVQANDTDPDGISSISAVTQPANGVVVNNGTDVSYTPNANYCNTPPGTTLDTFTYTLAPGGSSTTVTVTVNCADDPPVAVADSATVGEDSGGNVISVLANDTDVDGGPMSVASVTSPANGTVVNNGTDVTYTPNANYCNNPPGTTLDTFNYTLNGGSSTTVTVTVTCVDDNPTAVNDSATVTEDASATTVNVLANDTDPDGGTMTIGSVTQPANGTVVNNTTDVSYTPNADYCNNPPGTTPDTFTYTLNGGSTATVSVTVTCADDDPVAVADSATVGEDSGGNLIGVLANDTDVDGGPKSVASVTQPANGTVVNNGTDVTYTPNANYCNNPPGTTLDTFSYTLNGGSSATVTVTVTCADDPPLAVADSATVNEDSGANTINVQANDTDIDGGTNTISLVTQPANGAVVITNGGLDLTYAPNPNYCNNPPGTTLDTFSYTLSPGGTSATVTVTVTCVNDGPVLDLDADDDKGTGGANFAVTFTEGDPATLLEDPLDATLTDVDSANIQTLTVTLTNLLDPTFETLDADLTGFPSISKNYDVVGTPGQGILTLTGPDVVANFQAVLRTVTYRNTDADPDATARLINFVANDGTSNSNTATATVTIVPVDIAPTAVADSATVNEDSGANTINVLANDTDPDGGPKSVASVTQPANGTVTNNTTDVSYTPNSNYCNNPPGTTLDTFTYTLTPGGSSTTVTVTVTCVDDNPVAVADSTTVNEDSGANTINVLANDTDADGGPKSIASVTQPANGTVVNNTTDLSYAPNANYCNNPPGTTLDTFTYTLTPGGSSTTVTVTVTCVDDNPVAVADSTTVVEDSSGNTINVLANDTDVDGGAKSVTSVTQPANGTVVNNTTDVSYTPNPNYCNNPPGTTLDTFTYTLTPGGSSTTVTVTVTCVDDPPVAVADSATVNEDSGANTINVLANDTDIDAGPKSVTSVTQPANGTVVNNGTDVTYAPALNYCNNPPGTTLDTFTYTLTPGGSSTTVTVTVTCVNDPPVADPDAFDFIGNTQLEVDQDTAATPETLETTPSTFGVLDGDSDPVEGDAIAVTAIVGCADVTAPFDCVIPTTGTVSMQSNGRFSFIPVAGDTGATESFQYTVCDNGPPAPACVNATVTLTRFERVWYVKNDAPAGGTGRSNDPFDTLAEAQTASLANDWIFVYFGDGTTTGQAAGIALKSGQHLIGEHAGLSIPVNLNGNGSPTLLVTAVAGNRPLIDNTAAGGSGVSATDVIPNEVVGVNLAGNTNGLDWTTTAPFAGAGRFSILDNVVRSAGVEGVDINLAGTGATELAFSLNNLTSTGTSLDIQETGTGALTIISFQDNVVTGNTAGSGMVISSAKFDATPGGVYDQVIGGNTAIGASGNPVGAAGMVLSTITGDIGFTDLDIFAGGGVAFSLNGTGAVNTGAGTGTRLTVGAGVGIFQATGGPAVSVNNATVDLQLSSLQSTNSPTTGVSLVNADDGTTNAVFSAGSGSTITGSSGTGFVVDSSNADVDYAGTLNVTAGAGVSLTNNTGGTIDFTGALTISSGANAAFTATGGGTVSSSDTTSTLTSTTGTALNVANTTIAAAGLKFRSIAANGAVSGIILNNTGALGGLTVSGTGAADSGGTIQNCTGDCISLTSTQDVALTNLQLTNATDNAVGFTTVTRLTLDSVDIATTGNQGIFGTTVTDFKFQNGSTMTGAGNGANESGIEITDLFGNSAITDSSVTGSSTQNVRITNNSATAGTLTVTNANFSNTSVAFGSDGLQVTGNNSSNITVKLTGGNTFATTQGDGVQITTNNNAVANVTINGSTSNYSGNLGSAINIAAANASSITALVSGFTGTNLRTGTSSANGLNAINIQNFDTSTINATVQNNVVTGFDNNASGVRVIQEANGTINANLNNNTISLFAANGIIAQARAGTGSLNLTVGAGNNVSLTNVAALDGVSIESGSSAGGDTNTVCLNMPTNTSAANAAGQQGYRLRQRTGTTFRLQNFGTAPCGANGASTTDVSCWVNTTKSNTGTTDIVIGTAFSAAPGNCPTATLPPP